MFTTSRYASLRTRKLARQLALEKKDAYVARGKKTIDQLAQLARKKGEEKITVVEEQENGLGEPKFATIKINELGKWSWKE